MTKSKGDYNYDEYIKSEFLHGFMDDLLQEGVSLMALDPKNDNKLIGIRTSYIIDKKDDPKPTKTLAEYKTLLPETLANILRVAEELLPGSKVFARYPDCKRIYNMFALGSHPEYRVRGLATKLVKHAFEVSFGFYYSY